MNILDKIIAAKRKEVEAQKEKVPVSVLLDKKHFTHECYPLNAFLKDPARSGIIAEFKRKSPSKNWINQDADAERVTRGYASFGASALSVLTDASFFGGSMADLEKARMNEIPVLRKDFIIDEYQIMEAKAFGADIILLIAACLTKDEVKSFARMARNLGLNVLLEIHTEEELTYISDDINTVGINNRNLKTFEVDIENSIRLAHLIPSLCKISESGIDSPDAIRLLREEGFDGFLIGERFMREKNPAIAFKQFLREIR